MKSIKRTRDEMKENELKVTFSGQFSIHVHSQTTSELFQSKA